MVCGGFIIAMGLCASSKPAPTSGAPAVTIAWRYTSVLIV